MGNIGKRFTQQDVPVASKAGMALFDIIYGSGPDRNEVSFCVHLLPQIYKSKHIKCWEDLVPDDLL